MLTPFGEKQIYHHSMLGDTVKGFHKWLRKWCQDGGESDEFITIRLYSNSEYWDFFFYFFWYYTLGIRPSPTSNWGLWELYIYYAFAIHILRENTKNLPVEFSTSHIRNNKSWWQQWVFTMWLMHYCYDPT